jgi:hypothetical protein
VQGIVSTEMAEIRVVQPEASFTLSRTFALYGMDSPLAQWQLECFYQQFYSQNRHLKQKLTEDKLQIFSFSYFLYSQM